MKFNLHTWVWIAFLSVLVIGGVYGFFLVQLSNSGDTKAIAWGLLIPGYVFFVPSAGMSLVNSIYTVFRVPGFKPIMKRAICLSLLLCVPAWLFIIFGSLGRWWQFYNIYAFFNASSRIALNGVLVVILGIALFVELVVVLRQQTMPRWAPIATGIIALASVIMVHTNLGAIFGAVDTRPLWSSWLLPMQFVVSAMLAGTALTILFVSLTHIARKGTVQENVKELFIRDYRFIAIVLIVINWVLIIGKWVGLILAPEGFNHLQLLIAGPFSTGFWGIEVALGTLVPLVIMTYRQTRQSFNWVLLAAALITIGLFVGKYDLIIGGQSISGIYPGVFTTYFPNAGEVFFLIGGIAVLLLLYTLSDLLLPLETKD